MSAELRVASLNLRAYPNPQRGQINRLARIIREQECDVVLLQECLRPWLDVVCEVTGFTGVHSHRLSPDTPPDAFSPDGCAIAVRPSIELGSCRRIPPESFMPAAVQRAIFEEPPADFEPMPERLAYRSSGRSILAEIVADGETVVVGSFHATPGSGSVGGMQVGEWKPFFHGAVAVELAALEGPFAFAIDANEPFSETVDSIAFHWEEGRSGVAKIQALLGREPIHRGRDLFREWLATTGGEPVSRRPAAGHLRAQSDVPTALRLDLGHTGVQPHPIRDALRRGRRGRRRPRDAGCRPAAWSSSPPHPFPPGQQSAHCGRVRE